MRAYLLTLLIGTLFGCSPSNGPLRYEITHLVRSGNLTLIDGSHLPVSTTSEQKVVFEDLFPGANWGHPARIIITDSVGEEISSQKLDLPPKGLPSPQDDPLRNLFTKVTKATFTLVANPKLKVELPKRFFALLLNGQANSFQGEPRQWNDFAFLYQTLTQIYGYLPEQIFIANTTHKDKDNDLDGDGKADIRYGSTKIEVEAILTSLKIRLTPEDHLLIAVNDHALRREGKTFLLLEGDRVSATEFGNWVRALPTENIIALYQQCFGGAFVRPTVEGKRIALSAATDREFSWATRKRDFNEFFYWIVSAFAGQLPNGKPIKSDLNQDEKITVQEAFAFALSQGTRPESPLLESAPYLGTAKKIGLGG